MAKKGEALSKVETTSIGIDNMDDLAGIEVDATGLEEAGAEDLRIPVKVWNFKGKDAKTGRAIPPDVFWDSITEETQEQISSVLIYLSKQNEWREYVEAESRSRVRCRSLDRVNGTMEDGTERPCKGCPDAQWTKDEDGKPMRRCGEVYSVYGIEKDTRQPFVARFKRTSLPVIKTYLSRHFLGKRLVQGKRVSYPLFAYETQLTLRMSDDGKYALPVLERGSVLDGESIRAAAGEVAFVREMIEMQMDRLIQEDVEHVIEATPTRTSGPVNASEFSDDGAADNAATANF